MPKKYTRKARRFTQEDLLREAQKVEEYNLATVRQFELLEDERKKKRTFKKVKQLTGPIIRYRSVREEVSCDSDDEVQEMIQLNDFQVVSNESNKLITEVEPAVTADQDVEMIDATANPLDTAHQPAKKREIVARSYLTFENFTENPFKGWNEKPGATLLFFSPRRLI